MGSPQSVLTEGLGSWGSVNDLVTLGLGIGPALDLVTPDGIDFAARDNRPHYAATDNRPHYSFEE